MPAHKKILITGIKGRIAKVLIPALSRYDLVYLDINDPENPVNLIEDDLAPYLKGVDFIIHLAANPDPKIDSTEVWKYIEMAQRLIEACHTCPNLERVVNFS